MSRALEKFSKLRIALAISAVCLLSVGPEAAQAGENVLYSFQGGSDGSSPYGGMIVDSAGNLYGTTDSGGGGPCGLGGCGTVFKIAIGGAETVLHAFQGGSDGAAPEGNLVRDGNGNLYGAALYDGNGLNCGGCGTIFKITPGGTESILYAFQGGSDGAYPAGGLIKDGKGNFFGTTGAGGNFNGACAGEGCGTIFELKSDGTKQTLYAFQGGSDGVGPLGGVIKDKSGNLYGTTDSGGTDCDGQGIGCGTVFKIASGGTETLLHTFQGGSDGRAPYAGLILDGAGNLFGTTGGGGGSGCGGLGCGTVFKIAADGTERVLYSFQGGTDGYAPEAGLVIDKSGNLYGTTFFGGGTGCKQTGHVGCGTVFKLAPDGTETVLYAFKHLHGAYPAAALLLQNGILYGTASEGGTNNDGVVFSLKK